MYGNQDKLEVKCAKAINVARRNAINHYALLWLQSVFFPKYFIYIKSFVFRFIIFNTQNLQIVKGGILDVTQRRQLEVPQMNVEV